LPDKRLHGSFSYLFWGLIFTLAGVLWRLWLGGIIDARLQFIIPGAVIFIGLVLVLWGGLRARRDSRGSG